MVRKICVIKWTRADANMPLSASPIAWGENSFLDILALRVGPKLIWFFVTAPNTSKAIKATRDRFSSSSKPLNSVATKLFEYSLDDYETEALQLSLRLRLTNMNRREIPLHNLHTPTRWWRYMSQTRSLENAEKHKKSTKSDAEQSFLSWVSNSLVVSLPLSRNGKAQQEMREAVCQSLCALH